MECICFYFAIGVQKGASIEECFNVPKKSVGGPMNMALSKI